MSRSVDVYTSYSRDIVRRKIGLNNLFVVASLTLLLVLLKLPAIKCTVCNKPDSFSLTIYDT